MKKQLVAFLGVCAVVCLCCQSVMATDFQYINPYPPTFLGQVTLPFQLNICNTLQCGGGSGKSTPAVRGNATPGAVPPQVWNPAATRYAASPAVSVQAKAAYVQQIQRQLGPDKATLLADRLAKLDVPADWESVVADNGLRTGDVVDALASYFVANWVVANKADCDRPQTLAVRDAMRATISSGLAQASNAERQKYAEMTMLVVLLRLEPYAAANKAADNAKMQLLSDFAERDFLNTMKIDLRRLALTDHGFVPK